MLRGHTRTRILLATTALVLTGCRDSPTVPPDPSALAPPELAGDLDLRFPVGRIGVPVDEASPTPTLSPPASSRVETVAPPTDLTDVGAATIYGARTQVGFRDGYAFAYGSHYYSGNVGRIDVEATASHEDKFLGKQPATAQQNVWFLLNFEGWKLVSALAKIPTQHTCGVTVSGNSRHSTWWEFYQGVAVQTWGEVIATSTASPSSQAPCTGGTGGYGQTEHEPGGLVCSYWITYDLDTGVIISADFLGCSRSGGPLL